MRLLVMDMVVRDHYVRRMDDLIDKWLALAVDGKVKEISLQLDELWDNYCIPKILECEKYLTKLCSFWYFTG
ncbi:hypothetical protein CsatA_005866 [Cannabis sativa]